MRVGIVGAGQLGRMLALAGYRLGIRSVFLDPDADSSGGQVGPVLVGAIDDAARMRELAAQVDVVTFDIENVPVEALEAAGSMTAICPPPPALAVAQDRFNEKQLFEAIGVATAPYVAIAGSDDLATVGAQLGWPIILKARRLGYDGRGQRLVRTAQELESAWRDLGSVPAIAEAWIQFEREVSLIAVRGADGSTAFYPLGENVHDDGILDSTSAPYIDEKLQSEAEGYLDTILQRFDYRGVLTVEFFVVEGRLVANEIAPRVHNSGHWTIEGAETSQFENHLRAVLGLPLGSTKALGHAYMINLLGEIPDRKTLLSIPGLHLHDYGKSPRPLRKLGHCTLVDSDKSTVLESAAAVRALISKS
ncbi:MAG: 5-(carboxyamino)imidazole ribonucleotide synthase [Gammaproteobacteria bacterium]|nr:5-(carboxyamino)imidazole ribonucleotide synthase [Gammaproteobacteria bacterium]